MYKAVHSAPKKSALKLKLNLRPKQHLCYALELYPPSVHVRERERERERERVREK